MSKETIGETLRRLRLEKKLPLRKVAAALDIDVAILSKIERGQRKLTKSMVQKLAKIYDYNEDELMMLYLQQQIMYVIGEEDMGLNAIQAAEAEVRYAKAGSIHKKSLLSLLNDYFSNEPRVKAAWLFGSFARGEEKMDSDIDIMVRFDTNLKITLFDFADIAHSLEMLTKRKIDLVEEGVLQPFALKTAQKDLIKIYG
jgi:predicted nucleotidyltransferase/plasmid maintenance system antidote protein VapI